MRKKKPIKRKELSEIDRALLKEFLLFLIKFIGTKVDDKLFKALLIGAVAAAGNFYEVDEKVMLNREPPAVKVQTEKAQ